MTTFWPCTVHLALTMATFEPCTLDLALAVVIFWLCTVNLALATVSFWLAGKKQSQRSDCSPVANWRPPSIACRLQPTRGSFHPLLPAEALGSLRLSRAGARILELQGLGRSSGGHLVPTPCWSRFPEAAAQQSIQACLDTPRGDVPPLSALCQGSATQRPYISYRMALRPQTFSWPLSSHRTSLLLWEEFCPWPPRSPFLCTLPSLSPPGEEAPVPLHGQPAASLDQMQEMTRGFPPLASGPRFTVCVLADNKPHIFSILCAEDHPCTAISYKPWASGSALLHSTLCDKHCLTTSVQHPRSPCLCAYNVPRLSSSLLSTSSSA